jgi:hypothetical protein
MPRAVTSEQARGSAHIEGPLPVHGGGLRGTAEMLRQDASIAGCSELLFLAEEGSDLLREPLIRYRLTVWCSTTELQPHKFGRGWRDSNPRPRSARNGRAAGTSKQSRSGNALRTSNGEANGYRMTRVRSSRALHGNRTHGTGREDRTLLNLCVRQMPSPDDEPRV